ncbi:MAG: hypothetical protein HFI44_08560 [Lachnospiraceae bacterium]|nr:hypothetical protein [Lachnospiraceae bacterium]
MLGKDGERIVGGDGCLGKGGRRSGWAGQGAWGAACTAASAGAGQTAVRWRHIMSFQVFFQNRISLTECI